MSSQNKVVSASKPQAASQAAATPARDQPAGVKPSSPKASSKAAKPVKAASANSVKAKAAATVKALPKATVKPVPVKLKMERDSFTMPKDEYAQIAALKKRLEALARPTKKSELLRAGLKALSALDNATLLASLNSLAAIKTGRPKQ